jgi:hypothetical protein
MDEAEKLRWPFSDGSVTDLLHARSVHGSPVRPPSSSELPSPEFSPAALLGVVSALVSGSGGELSD